MAKKPKKKSNQPALPADPRDFYIQSERKISLEKLAALYKGVRGCSKNNLCKRSSLEHWPEKRKKFWDATNTKVEEKLQEKTVEQKVKTITELNAEHNKIVDNVIKMGQALLAQYLVPDPKTGKQKITCHPKEYRATVQTLIELIQTQRLLHNYDPTKPVGDGDAGPDELNDELIEALNASAQEDWGEYGDPIEDE